MYYLKITTHARTLSSNSVRYTLEGPDDSVVCSGLHFFLDTPLLRVAAAADPEYALQDAATLALVDACSRHYKLADGAVVECDVDPAAVSAFVLWLKEQRLISGGV